MKAGILVSSSPPSSSSGPSSTSSDGGLGGQNDTRGRVSSARLLRAPNSPRACSVFAIKCYYIASGCYLFVYIVLIQRSLLSAGGQAERLESEGEAQDSRIERNMTPRDADCGLNELRVSHSVPLSSRDRANTLIMQRTAELFDEEKRSFC